MPKSILETEQKVFDKNLKKWLKMKLDGIFVIIKENEVLGFAGSFEEGYKKGLSLVGNNPMFVKQIQDPKVLEKFHTILG